MKTKHTPGEWCVKHDKTGMPFIGVKSDPIDYPGTVAVIDGGYPEADARLIAAAPDLLILQAARNRGALVAGNDGNDLAETSSFPVARYTTEGSAANWIEVGAASWKV
jgi:hypothetical protein